MVGHVHHAGLRQIHGGPVPTGAGHRGVGAGDPRDAAAERGNAWSRMSFTRPAKLPHSLMMAICSSRQSGWPGRMPRSRQMSAKTAPIGGRRTLAAICSGVGRCTTRALASSAEGAVACRGARGVREDEVPRGVASRRSALRRSLASSALARCRLREMRARISATSAVPKQDMTGPRSVKARRRIVAASFSPGGVGSVAVHFRAA
jgi:hypothetical protein